MVCSFLAWIIRLNDCKFPASWQADFLGLPQILFMESTTELCSSPIKSFSNDGTGAFRAKFAFERLLLVGQEVRIRMESLSRNETVDLSSCEAVMQEGLRRFSSWASKDAGLTPKSLSLFLVSCSRGRRINHDQRHEEFQRSSNKMLLKLRRLSQIHREAQLHANISNPIQQSRFNIWSRRAPAGPAVIGCAEHKNPPASIIYGFHLTDYKLNIVSLNTSEEQFPVRTLLTIDYSEPEQDLWSAIAIVLTVMAARDACLRNPGLEGLRSSYTMTAQFSKMQLDSEHLDEDA